MARSGAVEYQPLIKELPASERPRERLKQYGASSLSNAELLAVILRTGAASESVLNVAARLLAKFGGLPGLSRTSFNELCSQHGLGKAKSAQIKAALELGRRLLSTEVEERMTVRSPADVANLLLAEMGFLEQEELRLLLLDTRNQVLAVPQVYKGSVNTSQVRIGELFRDAVRQNSPAIIIVHNHPSGDPTPSPEDVTVTEQALKAGKLLDIDVLDHIIFGRQRYVSLKERGLGFG
ncbi:MAG: DNA repair protein RadC [Dehalococcoidia bacterium]|nr:DNA repair protein RadC [Dehalococcoidia bacterium]